MKRLILNFLIVFMAISSVFSQKMKITNPFKTLLIGTYTAKGSEGIYVYRFNTKTGDFEHINNTKGIENPSFLAISPNKKNVYSVKELGNLGGVAAFAFNNKTGDLKLLNTSTANGDHPCHLEMNADGKHLGVGNYSGGNLCLFEINKDGSLKENPQVITHEGSGPNKSRQEKAHVHSVNWSPDQKHLFVPDLGIDKIVHYQLIKNKLIEGKPAFTTVSPGAGPRHFTFHPNGKFAYVIQELNSEITAFNYSNGALKAIESVSTLPTNYSEQSFCADIHISPDGQFLYGSNRGHNSLAIYAINQQNGRLKLVDIASVNGNWPRNFMIDPTGSFVLVANERSDNVVIFKRNKISGKLTATGKEIQVSMPVCLKML
jgi:6-phosphogluconolactonase